MATLPGCVVGRVPGPAADHRPLQSEHRHPWHVLGKLEHYQENRTFTQTVLN